ncbi:MAG: serine hydrolase [Myxococcales bacterium]|nr:serine hydrolase [Myxococcales bacterium]
MASPLDVGGPPDPRDALFRLLEDATREGVFPGCVALVWRDGATLYHEAHGMLASAPEVPEHAVSAARDTVYDLASLTKVLATTTLWALTVSEGRVALDAPVPAPWSRACPGATLADLLEHCAGLTAHREYFLAHAGRPPGDVQRVLSDILATPPAYPPRRESIYSDLGFILLGAWLERVHARPLDELFENRVAWALGLELRARPVPALGYHRLRPGGARGPARAQRSHVAPTEVYDPALHPGGVPSHFAVRRDLPYAHYEVHDDNALVMAGVAGHAGLFGDAEAVFEVARAWLTATLPGLDARVRDRFWRPSTVPGSTRRLGWDGPGEGGSAGDAVSAGAVGHTGYTGTSLWIDPARQAIYVLLSNRVHPTRERAAIQRLRPQFHALASRIT